MMKPQQAELKEGVGVITGADGRFALGPFARGTLHLYVARPGAKVLYRPVPLQDADVDPGDLTFP